MVRIDLLEALADCGRLLLVLIEEHAMRVDNSSNPD